MKPAPRTRWASLTVFGLAAAATANLHAQQVGGIELTVNLTATAIVQGPDNGGSPVDKVATTTVRFATKDILKRIAAAHSETFPSGAKLVLVNGSFLVVAKNFSEDVSSFFTVTSGGVDVRSGQSNSDTSAESFTDNSITSIAFDDGNGSSFTLTGQSTEIHSLSAANASTGLQKGKDSISLTGSGEGSLNGSDAVVSGKFTASGSGTAQ